VSRRTWIARARAVHPFPSLLVSGLTVALVPIADGGAAPGVYVVLGVSMLCYQFSIGLTNDIVDADDDAMAKPWKAVACGALPRHLAVALAVGLGTLGLGLSGSLGFGAWTVGVCGLSCGLAYDLWLKRTQFSWLPFAIALPLIPVWVFVATDRWASRLWWALPLGAALGFALHLANQASDAEADERMGSSGFVARLGERRARSMALVLFGSAAVASVAALDSSQALSRAAPALIALAANAAAMGRWRQFQFGTMAVSSGALALSFLSAI
jgi:4-hydroxybenzoate polyprenyltransferase